MNNILLRRRFVRLSVIVILVLAACTAPNGKEEASAILESFPSPMSEDMEYMKITPEEAKDMMTDTAVILDVRTDEEFLSEHILNAVLLPDNEVMEKAETVLPDKNQVILVYCRTGIRSAKAANELISMGYTRVYDFGGIADWPYETVSNETQNDMNGGNNMPKLYYQGHGSFRLTSADGRVIYVDPYAGDGYDLPADIILVTHQHGDHNQVKLCAQKPDCRIISNDEALEGGKHNRFDIGGIIIQAVEASNKNHDPKQCVGYIITIDGIKIYAAGDTSKTSDMESFAVMNLDYALLPIDGVYNMGPDEAAECARIIKAAHNIPIHMKPGELFDRERADMFDAPDRLIVSAGEEIIFSTNTFAILP